jgi:hypothetical protein
MIPSTVLTSSIAAVVRGHNEAGETFYLREGGFIGEDRMVTE